jgi:hypothetical protein
MKNCSCPRRLFYTISRGLLKGPAELVSDFIEANKKFALESLNNKELKN